MNLERIYCGLSESNNGMRKLAEYLLMKKEGVRRNALYLNGKYSNIIDYGILRHEYFTEKNINV